MDSNRLIFMHLHKCGGTSLLSALADVYKANECFTIDGTRFRDSAKELIMVQDRNKYKLIQGHMIFGLHKYFEEGENRYFTMLREPVSRIISLYNYANENPSLTYHKELKEKQLSLVDFCKSGMAPTADNGMTRFISGNFIDKVPYGECNNAMLETAKLNIENYFSVVGLQEQFDLSMLLFHKVLGLPRYPFYIYKNKTKNKRASKISDTELDAIMPYIKYDIELYKFVKIKFEKEVSLHPELLQNLKIYREANEMKQTLTNTKKKLHQTQKSIIDFTAKKTNNCLILGSGRSGTSMMAGILHDAGYFLGDNLYPARDSNPKGFFENAEINGINERILEHYDNIIFKFMQSITKKSSVYAPTEGQRWLSLVSERKKINYINENIVNRIKEAVKIHPFGYKDPRFSYTLGVWKNYLPKNTKYIVMFRDPSVTVNSIIKECSSSEYLHNLKINYDIAMKTWSNMYKHILKNYEGDEDSFLFVHYDQVYSGVILSKLSKFLNIEIKNNFVDKSLKRSIGGGIVSSDARNIYNKLLLLAEYNN